MLRTHSLPPLVPGGERRRGRVDDPSDMCLAALHIAHAGDHQLHALGEQWTLGLYDPWQPGRKRDMSLSVVGLEPPRRRHRHGNIEGAQQEAQQAVCVSLHL